MNPVQIRKLELIRDFALNAPASAEAFAEETTLKDLVVANKEDTAVAAKDTTLTASAPTTVSRPTEDEDTRVSRLLATKFGDEPSFSGHEDACEPWMKTITARLEQVNIDLFVSDSECATNHLKENHWFCHSLKGMSKMAWLSTS